VNSSWKTRIFQLLDLLFGTLSLCLFALLCFCHSILHSKLTSFLILFLTSFCSSLKPYLFPHSVLHSNLTSFLILFFTQTLPLSSYLSTIGYLSDSPTHLLDINQISGHPFMTFTRKSGFYSPSPVLMRLTPPLVDVHMPST